MAKQLRHDLAARAGRHRLPDEIAGLVDKEAIAPEYADVFGLADKMRLVRDHDRGQPARVREGDEAALAGRIAGEFEQRPG